jgi:hypothetical protein
MDSLQQAHSSGNELEKAKIERTVWERYRKLCPMDRVTGKRKGRSLGEYLSEYFHCSPKEATQRSTLLRVGISKTRGLWDQIHRGELSLSEAYARTGKLNGQSSKMEGLSLELTPELPPVMAVREEDPTAPTLPPESMEGNCQTPSSRRGGSVHPEKRDRKRRDLLGGLTSPRSLERELAEVRLEFDRRLLALDERIVASHSVKNLPAPVTSEAMQPLIAQLHRDIYAYLEEKRYLNSDHVRLSRLIQGLLRGVSMDLRIFSVRLDCLRDTDTSPVVTGRKSAQKALQLLQFTEGPEPSFEEIKTRYRKMAAQAHPDHLKRENDLIIALNDAFETLTRYHERKNHAA